MLINQILERKNHKPIIWDAFFKADQRPKPLVIFCHGYKGFKDWGCWDLVAQEFVTANFCFIKFNFSHNGGTVKQPIDFPDLEAFSDNNYSKELLDLEDMITFLLSEENPIINEINPHQISLIGHSRGGGISIIKASEDKRVKKLVTWASISDFGMRFHPEEAISQWQEAGVMYVLNGRTKQQMPHKFQFYEDFIKNKDRLNLRSASQSLKIPHLIIHGKNDPSVPHQAAVDIHAWNQKSELLLLENANHVFGAKHPWEEEELPSQLSEITQKSIDFIS
ncbi:MAG: alpha/beta hydrolase [Flavobacteriaceae bacterium]|nr:alpha/beta hydrolase [Flavobacteriaceae bacterium]